MQESIKTAKNEKFGGIQCMALSLYTHKICQKFNFDDLYSIKYEEYLQNGKNFFNATQMGEHQEGTLFIRKF